MSRSPLPVPIVRRSSPANDIRWILIMVMAVVIPAALTLSRVKHHPDSSQPLNATTPYGYTVSLLLFLFPVILLTGWRLVHPHAPKHKMAFLWASGVIAGLGFVLDTFFGYLFFVFRNQGATMGLRLPAFDFATLSWVPAYLPVEEFGFYIFGALFVIAVYMWADAEWLSDYTVDDFATLAKSKGPLLRIHYPSLVWWASLTVLGVWYKMSGPNAEHWPGYFLFIMVLGFLPTALFLHTVRDFVNWRAFAFAYANLTLLSILWEATLGVPYDWWNYHHDQMLGINIEAWSSLPIEAVLLWLVIAWDCVIAFELFRVFFHMDRTVQEAMLGVPGHPHEPAPKPRRPRRR